MSRLEEKEVESRMRVIAVYDDLKTAPTGAVIIYEMKFTDTHGSERDTCIASFDDGNVEMVWGIGVDLKDALESASVVYSHVFRDTPEIRHNPFREVLER